MAKTKIIVIQMKEIIYTALFIGLGILLIVLLVFLFKPKGTSETTGETASIYNAGKYTAQIALNNTALDLEVTVDPDRVKSVRLVNIDDSVTTMFPLLQPALDEIEAQLISEQNIDSITISENSKYTQTLLIDAISKILDGASTLDNAEETTPVEETPATQEDSSSGELSKEKLQ